MSLVKNILSANLIQPLFSSFSRSTCYRASLGRNRRPAYSRLYTVNLVKPDGSSIRIQYPEPIALVKLPCDLNQVDEAERKKRLLKRQMSSRTVRKAVESIVDKSVKFDPKKYINETKRQK